MDYEGFRQMVLGANIFPSKANQLQMLAQGQPTGLNPVFDLRKKEQSNNIEGQDHRPIKGNSELHCNSFREFKKKFLSNYSKELTVEQAKEAYALLQEQDEARLNRIFNIECEANILAKVVKVFTLVLYLL